MASAEPFIVINDLSGGLNLVDAIPHVPVDQVIDVADMEWYQSKMPRPRKAASAVTTTGFAPTGTYRALFRHTPQGSAGETQTELWALTSDPAMGRYQYTGWSTITISDTLSNPDDAQAQSYRNRLFWAYDSNQDRTHVWDGTSVRRVGMGTPAAPTVANTGAGTYAATLRYYKVSYVEISGADIIRRSELSAAQSFTPSGTGTHARVTKPASISEGETHWELWGSADGVSYYKLASTAVGTTTFDDNVAPSAYSANELAPDSGTNTAPLSVRYLAALDARLFMARAWETDKYDSRVWWTPIFGTSGIGDEERWDATTAYYVDVDPGAYGPIKGLGVLMGNLMVWKSSAVYKLIPTGDVNNPYLVVQLSANPNHGLVHQRSVVNAPDEHGSPCVYWASERGLYRYGAQGIQHVSYDIQPLWDNWLTLSTSRSTHAVYHAEKNQIYWFFAAGASALSGTLCVLHISHMRSGDGERTRRGWSYFTNIAAARCSCMHSHVVDGSGTGVSLKPYIGRSSETAVWKLDASSSGNDPVSSYRAAVYTAPLPLAGPMTACGITEMSIVATALSSQDIAIVLHRDYGTELRSYTVSLTASSEEITSLRPTSQIYIYRKFEDVAITGCQSVIVKLWDGSGDTTRQWYVADLTLRYRREQQTPRMGVAA